MDRCSNSCEKSQRKVREEKEPEKRVVEKQCGTVSSGNMLTSRWHLMHRLIEGSNKSNPTICRDGKAEVGRVREEKRRRETIREKKDE